MLPASHGWLSRAAWMHLACLQQQASSVGALSLHQEGSLMFKTLLIANRGEIACRIIRTAKHLGIETVAVYSDADKHSLHVQSADHAIYLGPSPAEQSYLNVSALLEAAKHTCAQAIHPGYGFLSESPLLAKACIKQGITFIGPSVQALEIMGSKQQSKVALSGTSVPLTPGYHGQDQTAATLEHEAKQIGFPVLIKAAAGGGGKGMRIVKHARELKAALQAAHREAKAYFGDPTLILEKFIPEARHVEVQILGDQHGQIIPLFDRDCSIQRRHQKIIEEAPAPHLTDQIRSDLYQAACQVGKVIDYVSAGTIEFLVEPSGAFYFMEMNTRLQVEHPVTEAITGLDLVEWQIRIAQGEALPARFSKITPTGHAIECRIYAEDPSKDFLPSTGEITICASPAGDGIRLDTGYTSGDTLTPYYDPLISKLITTGASRDEAIQRMQQALKQYHIAGVTTNLSFLQEIMHHPAFVAAQLATHFLTTHPILPSSHDVPLPVLFLLFAYDYLSLHQPDPIDQACFAFHPFLPVYWEQTYQVAQTQITGRIQAANQTAFTLTCHENTYPLSCRFTHQMLFVSAGHTTFHGHIYEKNNQLYCFYEGQTYLFQRLQHTQLKHTASHAHASPMPGTVVAVLKQKGDSIEPDEGILIIEAMKMEHTIRAAESGIIAEIFYQHGDQVEEGAQLFSLQAISS